TVFSSKEVFMRIYFNPDNINFQSSTKSQIYVDKTMMLAVLNQFIEKQNKYICISRPRRFGKTIAGNMICAYYSRGCDSRELFAPFQISSDPSFEEKLNQYNVIKIDVNAEYRNTADREHLIKILSDKIKAEMQIDYPDITLTESDTLAEAILKIYAATGDTFMIIMDEYDVLVREQVPESLFTDYLDFLNGLFKADTLRPAIALAYLTGILPVVRDRVQSKLNNFREYTILDAGELAEFVGFTAEEVETLSRERGLDFEEFRKWYDGYRQHNIEIYNPIST
ncbi:MAG: AAA family ATPase, partial [Lachnospiraceae bacterium]|nr:AAA family ATPase [Lachnospiraceae bacterium]